MKTSNYKTMPIVDLELFVPKAKGRKAYIPMNDRGWHEHNWKHKQTKI